MDAEDGARAGRRDGFNTTCWTNILSISMEGTSEAAEAFGRFYREYWRPIEGYFRRKCSSDGDAGELTQAFFCSLLERNRLAAVQREGGRFRAYLLTAARNFLASEWQKRAAQKRGGGVETIPLDGELASVIPAGGEFGSDVLYDQEWAYLLIDKSLVRLQGEYLRAGKEALFQALLPCLRPNGEAGSTTEAGVALGMTPGACKVAAHRLRQRYGEIVRAEIGRTLGPGESAEEELGYLIQIVSQPGFLHTRS